MWIVINGVDGETHEGAIGIYHEGEGMLSLFDSPPLSLSLRQCTHIKQQQQHERKPSEPDNQKLSALH